MHTQDLEAIAEGHIDNTVESSQLHAMKTNKVLVSIILSYVPEVLSILLLWDAT